MHKERKCDCCCVNGINNVLEDIIGEGVILSIRNLPQAILGRVESVNCDLVELSFPQTPQAPNSFISLCDIYAVAPIGPFTTSSDINRINNLKRQRKLFNFGA
ncbi:hypothetical protein AAIE21_27590 [Paenibacillus sp. 102]|uniref:hypothetical protein n=1 Tax=Paenibacillus sp. 102 TaxID=3120823 RepID=UPI0031BB3027